MEKRLSNLNRSREPKGQRAGRIHRGRLRKRLTAWVLAIRPRTLGASVVPVGLGLAIASHSVNLDYSIAIATIAAALLLQVTTNLANDYYDFIYGIDTDDRLGPSRVTQSGLLDSRSVRLGFFITLSLALAIGLYLLWHGGWPILLISVCCLRRQPSPIAPAPYPLCMVRFR